MRWRRVCGSSWKARAEGYAARVSAERGTWSWTLLGTKAGSSVRLVATGKEESLEAAKAAVEAAVEADRAKDS